MNVERTVIMVEKNGLESFYQERVLNHLEITEMVKFLIYSKNCKFCQFGGVSHWPCYLPLPNLSPTQSPRPSTQSNPFHGSVLDKEHKEQNGTGMEQ